MIPFNEVTGSKLQDASFALLRYELLSRPSTVAGKTIHLLVGTDEAIGKEEGTDETRVALTPFHVSSLVELFRGIQATLKVSVISGAGARAGFSDNDYEAVGCTIVKEAALSASPRPDVVLSLKEPSRYEGRILGQFLRIGALHWPLYRKDDGLHALLKAGNYAAIFDGGAVGGSGSQLFHGGYRTPVVSTMGYFAGVLAAEDVIEKYKGPRPLSEMKVIVGGAGAAGAAAAKSLMGKCAEVVIIDIDSERLVDVAGMLRHGLSVTQHSQSFIETHVTTVPKRLDDAKAEIADAAGVIICFRDGTKEAEALFELDDLSIMARGAVLVDIPIDQGGSVRNLKVHSDTSVRERITSNTNLLREQGLVYAAQINMPFRRPVEASHVHGSAILPYVAALLFACAERGGAVRAARYVADTPQVNTLAAGDSEPPYLTLLISDLRRGLAFTLFEDFRVEGEAIRNHPLAEMFRSVAVSTAPDA